MRKSRSGRLVLIAALGLFFSLALSAQPPAETVQTVETAAPTTASELPDRFAKWLREVETLITAAERTLFLSLTRDYQRDAFIEQFWKVRDPYPRTTRNELKERWPQRVAQAYADLGGLDDDRARIFLVHGPPTASFAVQCTTQFRPAEVWGYEESDHLPFSFAVVFFTTSPGTPARVWRPGMSGAIQPLINRSRSCINGARLAQILSLLSNDLDSYESKLQQVLAKPRPSGTEWVNSFVAYSTEMPEGGESLDGDLEIQFPGRHQLRTVVQGLLTVPRAQAVESEYADYRSYNFQLTGEVLRDGRLFDRFRYKFGFPADRAGDELPMAFQRYLRPGLYTLILRLDDLGSDRVYRIEQPLGVPRTDQAIAPATFRDPLAEQLFAEATAALELGETSLQLIRPQGDLLTGFTRFDTLMVGDAIKKVRFYLDDKLVLTKNKPPYNVSIDLGDYPDLHTLRAEGIGEDGAELADDEILINGGGYRFLVKLVEPRKGKRYEKSVRARVEVEVPDGRELERLELYVNETLAATLYQPPFVHPILLPESNRLAYVRAVAYLPDGNSTEDLVFINAPANLDELEVQFVELYTTVLDRQGRPVEGLEKSDFTVLEDGVKQSIRRFERVVDQPIHVGVLIDNSASMVGTLDEVRRAALSFFQQAIRAKDRAAVVTFNNFPNLAVELTSDRRALGAGLAGLVAEGQTALYDSIMFSLYYFTGIRGQRALLVLSDGKDESSRFDFDQTLDYARRAGITIYSIGFRLTDSGARARLAKLADETGGRSFFLADIAELEVVYTAIQRELRSQYLIAYQSSNTAEEREFRSVELKTEDPSVTVKTLSGYYP